MRKPGITVVLVALLLALLMATCDRREQTAINGFTVRTISSEDLAGRWDRAAQMGLVRIGEELGADVEAFRVIDSNDARARLLAVGREPADLVFCTGSLFEKSLYTEAAAFPGTIFVLLPGRVRGGNLAGIQFLPEEAGYLAGAVAGVVASGKRAGVLRGEGQAWLEALEEGFAAGFHAHRNRTEVITVHGVDGAASLAAAGVEVALYATDFADPEILAAARSAGLKLVATDRGLMSSNPDLIVAAVEIDVAEAMVRVAREVRDGAFSSKIFAFDLGSGVVDVILSDGLSEETLEGAGTALADARAEVTAGYVAFDELGL